LFAEEETGPTSACASAQPKLIDRHSNPNFCSDMPLQITHFLRVR
jgi:hypothetical protein